MASNFAESGSHLGSNFLPRVQTRDDFLRAKIFILRELASVQTNPLARNWYLNEAYRLFIYKHICYFYIKYINIYVIKDICYFFRIVNNINPDHPTMVPSAVQRTKMLKHMDVKNILVMLESRINAKEALINWDQKFVKVKRC